MMFAAGTELVAYLDEFAPLGRALPDDNSGLQWGDLCRDEPALLLALDFNEKVLEEALGRGITFILTHHPFLYRPLQRLNWHNKREALIMRAIREGITLFAAHTNLDVASRGVSQALGELLNITKMQPLCLTGRGELEKLVVFVPEGYEERVRNALAEAGAGWIGNYSHCSYQVLGTGTFLPREGASPFTGLQGSLEKVREYRLETIFYRYCRQRVLEALKAVHPYEEVAYDLYPLANEGEVWGLGRIGCLAEEMTLGQLAERCNQLLEPDFLNVLGDLEALVEKVAVLGGSGAEYIPVALQNGAEVFISGDIKFHAAQEAALEGMSVIDAGHAATERPVLQVLARFLKEKIELAGLKTEVIISQEQNRFWQSLKKG